MKGINADGIGGVSARSEAGRLSAPDKACMLLQLTSRGIMMEVRIDGTVNGLRLESGVSVAKGHRG